MIQIIWCSIHYIIKQHRKETNDANFGCIFIFCVFLVGSLIDVRSHVYNNKINIGQSSLLHRTYSTHVPIKKNRNS